MLSSHLAAGRGIRTNCGASCPFGSLDRGGCGLVVGDGTACGPRPALIPLGRLPLPAPPPPATSVSLGSHCLAAAAVLISGSRWGSWPLPPGSRPSVGGYHAPTQVPLVATRSRHCSAAADAQPA